MTEADQIALLRRALIVAYPWVQGDSTATRRLNAGNIIGGCTALTWWNKAGQRVVRGLALRRGEERDLCMMGVR